MAEQFQLLVGIDWATESHRVCVINGEGDLIAERNVEHSGAGISQFLEWLRSLPHAGEPSQIGVGIEIPRGAIVEGICERGYRVFSINPKQMDRFRDRHTVAGAKDDRRDAFVIADSLRTDRHLFHEVRLDDPATLRIRDLSRLDDELRQDYNRVLSQLREQLQRYYYQLLKLSPAVDEPWVWDTLEAAPLPSQGARLTTSRVEKILKRNRIRRLDAAAVRGVLGEAPLTVAPGAAEAAAEHALLLLPRLRLLNRQRAEVGRRIQQVLDQMAVPTDEEPDKHRDVTLLLSLPGVGRVIAATMLAEASQPLAERDYHALRAYGGTAPITRQSGKKRVVCMRQACNPRVRNALYHWARVASQHDPRSKDQYDRLRKAGHSHGRALRGVADRLLAVLVAILSNGSIYDPAVRNAPQTTAT